MGEQIIRRQAVQANQHPETVRLLVRQPDCGVIIRDQDINPTAAQGAQDGRVFAPPASDADGTVHFAQLFQAHRDDAFV